MWRDVDVSEGASGAPLLLGALGWLECRVREELATGSHTFFVADVLRAEAGVEAAPLLRVGGSYL
jgi:flavin reductase (DIM6/NTAB) family NADH-FMN oxidoreductase RutF